MRICPKCGALYEDNEAKVCGLDGTALLAPEQAAKTAAPREVSLSPGKVLAGRYRLESELGTGGFGAVYAAEDIRLGKRVAVKVLSPDILDKPNIVERFRLEALSASRIEHEAIVNVTDFDQDEGGAHFIVMEYLDGQDLARALRGGAFTVERALQVAIQAAFAMDAAHEQDIIHRDLKPANLFLVPLEAREGVKIIDFGIAKAASTSLAPRTLTLINAMLGTACYMAPEQVLGASDVDGRADIYALGIILYEMLCGQRPYDGDNQMDIVLQQIKLDPPAPSKLRAILKRIDNLDQVVAKAMAKDPEQRYHSMRAFGLAMLDVLEFVDPNAASAVRPRNIRPSSRNKRAALSARSSASVETQSHRTTPSRPVRPAGTAHSAQTAQHMAEPSTEQLARPIRSRLPAIFALLTLVAGGAVVALVLNSDNAPPTPKTQVAQPGGLASASTPQKVVPEKVSKPPALTQATVDAGSVDTKVIAQTPAKTPASLKPAKKKVRPRRKRPKKTATPRPKTSKGTVKAGDIAREW